jgi:hypothetical protein
MLLIGRGRDREHHKGTSGEKPPLGWILRNFRLRMRAPHPKINVNLEKSKIVHFRTQSVTRSNFSFIFNGKEVDIVSKYTYLNLLLTEFLSSISVRFKPHLRRCCGRCYRKRP